MRGQTQRSCLNCGRSEVRAIAPNYVECHGYTEHQVVIGQQQIGWAPFPGPPGLGIVGQPVFAAVWGTERRPCRVRRHQIEMTGSREWAKCLCGTFAIGECFVCNLPVCGDDSSREPPGLRVCSECKSLLTREDLYELHGLAARATSEDVSDEKATIVSRARERQARAAADAEAARQKASAAAPRQKATAAAGLPAVYPRCPGCGNTTRTRTECERCGEIHCWACLSKTNTRFLCPKCKFAHLP